MSQHAHKPCLHTRQRKSSILNTITTTTTDADSLSKHRPGLQVSNSRVSSPTHTRLLNLTFPFLNLPGSRIRKASPTVSLTHANVNVNAAAASCINIDIISIDRHCTPTQPQYDYHDHYLPPINVYDDDLHFQCQSQTINIIPFPSSSPAPCTTSSGEADWVSLAPRDVNVDMKTPIGLNPSQPPPYSHRRIPRKAIATPTSKPKSGAKSRSRSSKAKHVRAYVGSSRSSSRKRHKRLAADIQFLETVHRSVASHRTARHDRAGADVEKLGGVDAVMDAQEGLLLQRLSDLMIELGHGVPTPLSCESPSPAPPAAGPRPEPRVGVEPTSPGDHAPPSPLPFPRPRPLQPCAPAPTLTPVMRTPAFPSRPPGLPPARTPPAPIALPLTLSEPAISPPLSSPPLPTISMSPPVLSMPQLVAALMLRRQERGGGAGGVGRRERELGGGREGRRKSRLGVEVLVEGAQAE